MQLLQADKVAAIAQYNVRAERQLAEQCSTELGSRSGFTNDKRARSTYIYDIKSAQFSCEDARAKGFVSTNIDSSQENNESHT